MSVEILTSPLTYPRIFNQKLPADVNIIPGVAGVAAAAAPEDSGWLVILPALRGELSTAPLAANRQNWTSVDSSAAGAASVVVV